MKYVYLSFERTIRRARGAFAAVFNILSVFATRALAFAHSHGADGKNDHRQDNQQYYDSWPVHAMMALAMRKANHAQIQATTHWNRMMKSIHLVPNSRRTAAMAATHGV